MNIEFRKAFKKDLRNLKEPKFKQQIKGVIEDIEVAKNITDLRNVKAIQGHQGFYRIRIGNYRLGLYLNGNVVALVRFLHRKDMYRYFP